MFFPEGGIRVYLYGAPCDMRKSFNGLTGLVKHAMGEDPLSGHLFVFVNRRGNYGDVPPVVKSSDDLRLLMVLMLSA